MTASNDSAAIEFLKAHRLGVLATGRRDGSPQQALIGYRFDDGEFLINTGGDSAKAKNIRRQSRVSLSVTDGPKVVVVYGEARLARGDEAEALRARMEAARPSGEGRGGARQATTQPPVERFVIVMQPQKYLSGRLEG